MPDDKLTPATLRNISSVIPKFGNTKTLACFERCPDTTGRRLAEGGLRVQQKYKEPLPDLPLVTIITVCLNSSKTIEQTIKSVLKQTYDNIEYIVVDGGSEDATVNIISTHECVIDYYVSEPDGGLYAAMNKGLALASGDFVLILNSDDWYEPSAVRTLVDAYHTSRARFVSGRARNVDANGKALGDIRSMPWDESIRLRMPLRHETMLVPREIYDSVGGYDHNYRIIADFKFTLNLFEQGITHFEVPGIIMNFRQTGVSSVALDKLTLERARLMREQFPFLTEEDVEIFATHGRLSPEKIPAILKRYSNYPILTKALAAFVKDQIKIGAKKWISFNENLLIQADDLAVNENMDSKLRVATLCSMDFGGAGTGTQRRVAALRNCGIDAHIYSLVVKSKHNHVHRLAPKLTGGDALDQHAVWSIVQERAIRPLFKIKDFRASELFSLPESVLDAKTLAEVIGNADIVHMHWIVGMLDYEHVELIFGDRPVIWTLADMNPFTGGCHYSEDCEEYKKECQSCHLLGRDSDIAHQVWIRKKISYAKIKNLHIVCPTKWIYDRVRASSLLGDRPCYHVPNAFPIDQFQFINKLVARSKLGLPLDRKYILFGADSLKNKRKGGELLKKAVQLCMTQSKFKNNVELIVFGGGTTSLPIPTNALGPITDNQRLSLAYSAADVFVSPSIEDSGPMTVGEAMLCGTPVVSFKVGIALEMIQHERTGFLANRGSVDELAKGINWALSTTKNEAIHRSLRCRRFAAAFHNPDVAANRHIAIYNLALKNVSSHFDK